MSWDLGAHDHVLGVAIDQRRRHIEGIDLDDLLDQRNRHLALDALIFALDQLLAHLGTQIGQGVGLAAVLGQLVVQRRHLAATYFLDRDAQADFLAGQALDRRLRRHLVLDLQGLRVHGNPAQALGQTGHAARILVAEVDLDGASLDLVVADLAVHVRGQDVIGGRLLAILHRLEFCKFALVAFQGFVDLLVGDLGGPARDAHARIVLGRDLRTDLHACREFERLARLHLQLVDGRRRDGRDLLFLHGLGNGQLDHLAGHIVLDPALVQLLDDLPRHLAGPKALEPHLATKLVVGLVQLGGHVVPRHFEVDPFFHRRNVFNRYLHGERPRIESKLTRSTRKCCIFAAQHLAL